MDMLFHIKTEDLNAVMMRAHQQIMLLDKIKSLKKGDERK